MDERLEDPRWWRAEIRDFSVTLPGPVIDGVTRRPAGPQPPPPVPPVTDPTPEEPAPPSWFRSARLKVRIVQDQFVALELSGSVDFETALEERITSSGGAGVPIEGLGANPSDGIVDYLFLYQTDPASQQDEIKLYIGADPNDRDGLLMTGQLQGQPLQPPNTARNILGMTTVFTPLLAEIAPANPADGGLAPIALSAAVVALPSVLAEIRVDGQPLLNVERVVLFGGRASGGRRRSCSTWRPPSPPGSASAASCYWRSRAIRRWRCATRPSGSGSATRPARAPRGSCGRCSTSRRATPSTCPGRGRSACPTPSAGSCRCWARASHAPIR
jgi:large repetitive protein